MISSDCSRRRQPRNQLHPGFPLRQWAGAGSAEFRTAPLWGLGQRIFFLHDGRATPSNGGLLTAIQDHADTGSEANDVIRLFQQLNSRQQQDLLIYLRSL